METNLPYPCGPWRVDGACVKSLSHGQWSKVVTCDTKKFNEDGKRGTAARIVACFNACEGMNDPAVEISALRSRSDNVPAMCAEVEALRGNNAALVAALEAVVQHCVTVKGFPDKGKGRTEAQQAAYDAARAALYAAGRLAGRKS